jgi:hypothetical protein
MTLENAPPLPEVRFDLRVKRRYKFYIWKVVVPLFVMVMISWSAFWIRIDDHFCQMTVALTTILTVIAFAFSISASLPRVPYLTLIDAFFRSVTCSFFCDSRACGNWPARRQTRVVSTPLQRMSRWLFPVAYLVINVVGGGFGG